MIAPFQKKKRLRGRRRRKTSMMVILTGNRPRFARYSVESEALVAKEYASSYLSWNLSGVWIVQSCRPASDHWEHHWLILSSVSTSALRLPLVYMVRSHLQWDTVTHRCSPTMREIMGVGKGKQLVLSTHKWTDVSTDNCSGPPSVTFRVAIYIEYLSKIEYIVVSQKQ